MRLSVCCTLAKRYGNKQLPKLLHNTTAGFRKHKQTHQADLCLNLYNALTGLQSECSVMVSETSSDKLPSTRASIPVSGRRDQEYVTSTDIDSTTIRIKNLHSQCQNINSLKNQLQGMESMNLLHGVDFMKLLQGVESRKYKKSHHLDLLGLKRKLFTIYFISL